MLLNIGPGPDGQFDPLACQRLKEIGAWMRVNGEAIYETRPVAPYEGEDYIFTSKHDATVYAILLAKADKATLPESVLLPATLTAKADEITLLGYGKLKPGETRDGLTIMPIPNEARKQLPCACAWAFKLVPRH